MSSDQPVTAPESSVQKVPCTNTEADIPTLPLLQEDLEKAPEKLKKAYARIQSYPYDTEAWGLFLRDAQRKRIEEARQLYEKLVTQFPNCGKYWKLYIEHEMKARNYERVEKLFQRCLIKVLAIELWRLYLMYVKETKSSLPTYREKMAQAYDFALEKIGMDILSFPIWSEYVSFLKSVEAVGSYAENQRITAVRKIYQRGVVTPMWNIETLWKEYCAYENSINPIIAKKMIEDRGRDYMNARRVAKEYEAVTKGLNRGRPSAPPQNTAEEQKQTELWKKYIDWEKSNPLRTEDHTTITRRVMFAYEQCLLCLGYHADVWFEAASYLEQASRLLSEKGDQNAGKLFAEEAASVYERAIGSLLKKSTLLHFAYADFEETRMKYEKVHGIYKRYVGISDVDPTLCYIQYMKFARRAEGIKSARAVFKLAREDARSGYHVYTAAGLMEYYCSKDKNVAFKIFELGLKKYGDCPEYVLSYIDYMSHLNEDNNTRVLFERVLSSNQLAPEKSLEIWRRFLEFESNIGDLQSVGKVEKRRLQTIQQLKDCDIRETSLLIDRYKYADLYPCSFSELRSLGYKEYRCPTATSATSALVPAGDSKLQAAARPDEEDGGKMSSLPRPDVQQMIPFKPKQYAPVGAHPVPGGIFPPPPAASYLLTLLPPPKCFQGPFVMIDKFLEHFARAQLPAAFSAAENGSSSTEDRPLEPGTAYSANVSTVLSKKRARPSGGGGEGRNDESDDDDGGSLVPPANDIYRARQQQKRVK